MGDGGRDREGSQEERKDEFHGCYVCTEEVYNVVGAGVLLIFCRIYSDPFLVLVRLILQTNVVHFPMRTTLQSDRAGIVRSTNARKASVRAKSKASQKKALDWSWITDRPVPSSEHLLENPVVALRKES